MPHSRRRPDLLWAFIVRDLKLRYESPLLGIGMALVTPLSSIAVLAAFFSRQGAALSGEVPYPAFVLAGLVPWLFCSRAIGPAAQAIRQQRQMIRQFAFPRRYLPQAQVLSGGVELTLGLALALVVAFGSGASVMRLADLPWLCLYLAAMAVATVTLALVLSGLDARYRDFRYGLGIVRQLFFLGTPVLYASQAVDPRFRPLLQLNPFAVVIEGVRGALLGRPHVMGAIEWTALGALVPAFFLARAWFIRAEAGMAERV